MQKTGSGCCVVMPSVMPAVQKQLFQVAINRERGPMGAKRPRFSALAGISGNIRNCAATSLCRVDPRALVCAGCRRLRDQCNKGFNILPVRVELASVTAARFGADQCVRSALALGDVDHVNAVAINLLMQVLPSILADRKTMDFFVWVGSKRFEFAAVVAVARQHYVLLPIGRRSGWVLTAIEQKFGGMPPQARDIATGRGCVETLMQCLHCRHDDGSGAECFSIQLGRTLRYGRWPGATRSLPALSPGAIRRREPRLHSSVPQT